MVDLLIFNPWWESPERIESDRSIVEYQESKLRWQPKIRSDYSTMRRSFGRGILVTKNTFFLDENMIGIPAPVFFLLDA